MRKTMKPTKAQQERFDKMILEVSNEGFESGLRAAIDFVVNEGFDIKDLLGYWGIKEKT